MPESRRAFDVAAAPTSELDNLVFSRQTGLLECEHPLIYKPMLISEPAVPSTRLLGLSSRPYPNSMSRMLNKALSQFKQSLSRIRQNRGSEIKALLAGLEQTPQHYNGRHVVSSVEYITRLSEM